MTFTQGLGVALILVCLLWFIWVCLTSGRTPIQYFRFEGEDDADWADEFRDWKLGDPMPFERGGCFIEEGSGR